MYIVIAILLGIILGFKIPVVLSTSVSYYVSIAILAALDSILGAVVSYVHGKFKPFLFITGLLGNALLSFLLTYVMSILAIDIYLAIAVVFGSRMLSNLASLRRFFVEKFAHKHHLPE